MKIGSILSGNLSLQFICYVNIHLIKKKREFKQQKSPLEDF